MKTSLTILILTPIAILAVASPALAGAVTPVSVGAPAPLLGAGLPGLAALAVAGAGYVALRMRRRDRD